jgi:hypothetical protein
VYAIDASPTVGVVTALVVGVAAESGSLWSWWRVRRTSPAPDAAPSPWLRPLTAMAAVSGAAAVGLAAATWPRRDLLVAALLVTGIEAAAAGLSLGRPGPLTLAPALLCAGWLAFATDALAGDPDWFTIPIGVALLSESGVARSARRRSGQPPTGPELLVLEYVGMATVVGAPLFRTVDAGPAFGALAIAVGAGVTGWGALTRVRRRVWFGASAAVLAVFLMVAVPLVQLVPRFHGPVLWAALAGIGALLVVVATALEKGRATVQRAVTAIERHMRGWE